MLTILGFTMVVCFMYLIMTKRMSALIALILIPTVFALIGGFYAGLGDMMLDGSALAAVTDQDILQDPKNPGAFARAGLGLDQGQATQQGKDRKSVV